VLGIGGPVLSATSVLLQLQRCLNRAWKVAVVGSGFKHSISRRLRSGLLLVGAGILAIASVAAGSIISALSRMLPFAAAVHIGEVVTSLIAFALVFGGILKVIPDVKLRWSDVWVGGLFIAVLVNLRDDSSLKPSFGHRTPGGRKVRLDADLGLLNHVPAYT
jgi:membrane protein